MNKYTLLAATISAALVAPTASAVDFNGYMRAGTAISGNGEGDVAFEKNKVGRLGNEDDNYYEFGFSEELRNDDQVWRVESMIAQGDKGQNGWEGGDPTVAQFAVKAKGVFEFDKEATLWAGKTYYQRKDVHISDFYFLNTSGTGGGIENISLGNQKLSVALIQDGEDDTSTGYIADVRLANIGLWNDAALEVAMAYNFATEKDGKNLEADDGLLVTGILHQGMSIGFNQTVLQVGTAGYGAQMADLGAGAWYSRADDSNNDTTGYRLINWGVINLGDSVELGHQALYATSDHDGPTHDIASVVVRPMYKWNSTMRTIAEVGYFTETDETQAVGKQDKAGSKLTIAQAWAMGDSWWARPEIRVYGSYITDDEGTTFGEKGDSDFVAGIQVEAWW